MSIITDKKAKQNLYGKIFMEVVDVMKTYCNFIKQFNSKYITN